MKKIISILLVFCMFFSFSAVAFAQYENETPEETWARRKAFIAEKMAEGMTREEAADEWKVLSLVSGCGFTESEARQWVYHQNRIGYYQGKGFSQQEARAFAVKEKYIGYDYKNPVPEGFDIRDVDVEAIEDAIREEEEAQAQAEQEEYLASLTFWDKLLMFFQSIAAFFQGLPAMFEAFFGAIAPAF